MDFKNEHGFPPFKNIHFIKFHSMFKGNAVFVQFRKKLLLLLLIVVVDSGRRFVACVAGAGSFRGRNSEDPRERRTCERQRWHLSPLRAPLTRSSSLFRPINKPALTMQARRIDNPNGNDAKRQSCQQQQQQQFFSELH